MDNTLEARHPKIFVSYSHDDDTHRQRVLQLSQRLRSDGFDTSIDQYVEGTPAQGWPRWTLNQLESAAYVLLVCTEKYYNRFLGLVTSNEGSGVDWEGAIITSELFDKKSVTSRFIPVLFDDAASKFIPTPVRTFTHYVLVNEDAYTNLTNHLAGVAGVQRAELGAAPNRSKKTAPPLSFGKSHLDGIGPSVGVRENPELVDLCAPGGTMNIHDPFYIERHADKRANAAAALKCETLVIQGPHQFGKSSLLRRYVALCRKNGKTVALVDFSRFDGSSISSYGYFLTELAYELTRQLRLEVGPISIETQRQFLEFLETHLLGSIQGTLVFAFEETDRILPQTYAQDFFSMVRMWHNERADQDSQWHRVGLALVSSSEPKLYIRDAHRSPFAVGLKLALKPFELDDILDLSERYNAHLSRDDCVTLHCLLGGHPFLTQDAFYKLLDSSSVSINDFCSCAARDDGPFGDHLRAMLSNIHATDGLISSLKQVIKHGTVLRNEDFYRLEGAGLVRREPDRKIVPANKIYAEFFLGAV